MKMKLSIILVVGVLLAFNSGVQAVTIDWVTVGNAGNANDSTGYGGVSDVYQISTYEVTAGQYTEFLNAVAAADTYGLYNKYMDFDVFGCQITRNGTSGSYTYDFSGRPSGDESDWSNRPVNYVSWYDTLRFTNWLHNGSGTGDTETGAYTITDWDGTNGTVSNRNVGAQVWLPSEDEWYKAAYHKNDGVTGNYFDYPTSSDTVPGRDMTEATNAGNNANYYDSSGYLIGSPYYRTEVGEFELSDSPYGTFDMGGNVWEWNEALIHVSCRGVRGGSFNGNDYFLISSYRVNYYPYSEVGNLGFRVASVPEPADPIEEILDFIEDSVDEGALVPVKPGKPGQGQLGALINMVEVAGNLIDAELILDACWQLQDALAKTDGLEPPESTPDFVAGEAVEELASKIQELMTSLGCE